ncbi:hypothetical protein C0993_001723 [Termitomyces sp. T159_Od127]|nr:hypothetical protein C0993_001723 [Termitomyces sp. T159_Od127]
MATLSLGSSIIPQLMACINAAKDVHDTCDRLQLPRDTSFSTEGSNDDWTAAHERQAQAWAEDVLNRIHDAAMKCTLSPAKADKGKKPKFKHEYTVLLDKYFEFNAYPSAPDKMMLARKSGMTARQIEVWKRRKETSQIVRKYTSSRNSIEIVGTPKVLPGDSGTQKETCEEILPNLRQTSP